MSDIYEEEVPLLKFMGILLKPEDLELVLLKSHLLVEEALTALIYQNLQHPKFLDDARLTFAQKSKLARSISNCEIESWVWKAIDLLNKIRNKLAHNLNSEELSEKLDEFIVYVKSNQKYWGADVLVDEISDFHWASFVIYNSICEIDA